jgi:hypothetical protein
MNDGLDPQVPPNPLTLSEVERFSLGGISIGAILSRSLTMLWKNLPAILIVSMLVQLPSLLLLFHYSSGDAPANGLRTYNAIRGSIALGLAPLAAGPVTYIVFMRLRGTPVGTLQALVVGLRRLLPTLAVSILVGLSVLVGSLFFVIPGQIAMLAFYVAVPAAVIEKPGVFGALGRSVQLTSGYRWSIFGALFLMGLVGVVLGFVSGSVALGDYVPGRNALIVAWGVTVLTGAWGAAAAAVTYHDLRLTKDGAQTDDLARVFD